MTEYKLKNFIKFIKEKSTLIIFILGFVTVMIITISLFISVLLNQKSVGKITNEAASTQVGFDYSDPTIDKINKENIKLKNSQKNETSTYIAQPGDSSWKIAEKFLGSGHRYVEIEKLNNFKHGESLEIGQVILVDSELVVDDENAMFKDKEEISEIYIVKQGDSLWNIASEYYSDPFVWSQIYELNKQTIGTDPNLIFPLTELKLPVIKSRL